MTAIQSALYYVRSIPALLGGFDHPLQIVRIFLSGSSTSVDSPPVRLKRSGLRFYVRSAMDVWSIKETFLDDFYHFECGAKPARGTILDIGAGIGEYALQAAAACPNCRVIGFEPFPQSHDYFTRNIAANALTNVTAVKAAVSSSSGSLVMDVSSGNPLQFRAQSGASSENAVETVQLIAYLDANGIQSVDIIKLDCEGGEFDILLPLTPQDLQRFKRIVMEYHDGLTDHHHEEIADKLRGAGFSVAVVPNLVHGNIGYIYAQIS